MRVAWAPKIAGLPIDEDVASVLAALGTVVGGLGAEVVETAPDLDGAEEAFRTWRAWYYATMYGHLLRDRPDALDQFTLANIVEGQGLTGADLGRAETTRSALQLRVAEFFTQFDILVMPCAPVTPFPADLWKPDRLGGTPMTGYLDWLRHLYFITATGLPVISLPAGFSDRGLPVGVQIVAGPRRDRDALRFARALEAVTRFGQVRPSLARSADRAGSVPA
jgi:amidase